MLFLERNLSNCSSNFLISLHKNHKNASFKENYTLKEIKYISSTSFRKLYQTSPSKRIRWQFRLNNVILFDKGDRWATFYIIPFMNPV